IVLSESEEFSFLSKNTFYELYNEHLSTLHINYQWSLTIDNSYYDKIIEVVENSKSKNFNTRELHSESIHGGQKELRKKAKKKYGIIKQWITDLFVSACKTCQEKKSSKNSKIAGNVIVSNHFLSRIQIDIIDFSQNPYDSFKYIVHARDHFTRFSWARPIKSSTALEVATFLFEIFTIFGPPTILHSDNGAQFISDLISDLCNLWIPIKIKIIHGRPRHPQSQGSVERGNEILKNKLSYWLDETKNNNWPLGLNHVIFAMNNSYCHGINTSPYEAVFGFQHQLLNLINNLDNNYLTEEEIENNYILPEYIDNLDDLNFNDQLLLDNISETCSNESILNTSISTIKSSSVIVNQQDLDLSSNSNKNEELSNFDNNKKSNNSYKNKELNSKKSKELSNSNESDKLDDFDKSNESDDSNESDESDDSDESNESDNSDESDKSNNSDESDKSNDGEKSNNSNENEESNNSDKGKQSNNLNKNKQLNDSNKNNKLNDSNKNNKSNHSNNNKESKKSEESNNSKNKKLNNSNNSDEIDYSDQ
ncbi:7422_t:CDS:2, partial [Gigaspora rosea]